MGWGFEYFSARFIKRREYSKQFRNSLSAAVPLRPALALSRRRQDEPLHFGAGSADPGTSTLRFRWRRTPVSLLIFPGGRSKRCDWKYCFHPEGNRGSDLRNNQRGRKYCAHSRYTGNTHLRTLPIGASFRENKCIGYFSTFQKFSPPLPQNCPTPSDELSSLYGAGYVRDVACVDYVNKLSRCQVALSPPVTVSGACQNLWVIKYLNYNGCV